MYLVYKYCKWQLQPLKKSLQGNLHNYSLKNFDMFQDCTAGIEIYLKNCSDREHKQGIEDSLWRYTYPKHTYCKKLVLYYFGIYQDHNLYN
jgi:hypothetical protein